MLNSLLARHIHENLSAFRVVKRVGLKPNSVRLISYVAEIMDSLPPSISPSTYVLRHKYVSADDLDIGVQTGHIRYLEP